MPQPALRRPRHGRSAIRLPDPIVSTGLRAQAFVQALPDHRLLDRLVRGRAWIPLFGVMLAGIVAMQVEVLKLGASMGRSLQRDSALVSSNQLLRVDVARLADESRIEQMAAGMGMVMPAPDAVAFISARPNGGVGRAIGNIHSPNPAGFVTLLSSNGAVVGAGGQTAGSTSSSPGSSSGASATTGPTGVAQLGAPASTSAGTGAQAQAGSTAPVQSVASQSTSTPSQSASAPAQAPAAPPVAAPPPTAPGNPTGAAAIQPSAPTQTSTSPGG